MGRTQVLGRDGRADRYLGLRSISAARRKGAWIIIRTWNTLGGNHAVQDHWDAPGMLYIGLTDDV